MPEAQVRCYAELSDNLPARQRCTESSFSLEGETTVAELIAALEISSSDVDLILLNGHSVSLDAQVHAGDRVALYPVFESFDISSTQLIRSRPLRVPRFLLDVHLGKLAALLRMVGVDAAYQNHAQDEDLIRQSLSENRVLLSRDRALVTDHRLVRAHAIRSGVPEEQLVDVVGRFQLQELLEPFSRCLKCNSLLIAVPREEVFDFLPPRVRESQTVFHRCPSCLRVYWPGTHQDRMSTFIRRILHVEFFRREDH